jgi:hypothetical protein
MALVMTGEAVRPGTRFQVGFESFGMEWIVAISEDHEYVRWSRSRDVAAVFETLDAAMAVVELLWGKLERRGLVWCRYLGSDENYAYAETHGPYDQD